MRSNNETRLIFPEELPAKLTSDTVVVSYETKEGKTGRATLGTISAVIGNPEKVKKELNLGIMDAIAHKKIGIYDPDRYAWDQVIPEHDTVDLAKALLKQLGYRY